MASHVLSCFNSATESTEIIDGSCGQIMLRCDHVLLGLNAELARAIGPSHLQFDVLSSWWTISIERIAKAFWVSKTLHLAGVSILDMMMVIIVQLRSVSKCRAGSCRLGLKDYICVCNLLFIRVFLRLGWFVKLGNLHSQRLFSLWLSVQLGVDAWTAWAVQHG